MMKKLLGASAMAALVLSVAPASAARLTCSGNDLAKTESSVEQMADGEAKMVAFKEMTDAQTALLSGKMGACAMHLDRAAHAGVMK